MSQQTPQESAIHALTPAKASSERLPPIPAHELTDEQQRATAEFSAGRGYPPLGPFCVMLRSPEVMLRAKAMGDYLRYRNRLPKDISEMVILLTARGKFVMSRRCSATDRTPWREDACRLAVRASAAAGFRWLPD